ncbi:hypothetical protein [Burkholderia gladioli]|uniref:hypothetical protein n=1 Tax=Burkholderia gladioli TaxID=28095 RepID=UPI00163E0017|nr:hypothetical protein [Burkholderia gladioli]
MDEFDDLISWLRDERRNWTQIAERAELNPRTLRRIAEDPDYSPSMRTIRKLRHERRATEAVREFERATLEPVRALERAAHQAIREFEASVRRPNQPSTPTESGELVGVSAARLK